jgi:hypothetical protein
LKALPDSYHLGSLYSGLYVSGGSPAHFGKENATGTLVLSALTDRALCCSEQIDTGSVEKWFTIETY